MQRLSGQRLDSEATEKACGKDLLTKVTEMPESCSWCALKKGEC
jgi:hypothetical protein